ncbi:MAG: type II toxin-antitoxin system ParD family antitoxin [Gemmataceae bacterium]|nr:type II toxin-antitoxin system ParD family antitoxin [Gemmataceae bacterium]
MPTRNVHLTDHFDQFVESSVGSGRFSNASEVVREALRLMEDRDLKNKAKIDALRQAAKEGFDELDAGLGIEIRDSADMDRLFKTIQSEISKKPRRKSRNK